MELLLPLAPHTGGGADTGTLYWCLYACLTSFLRLLPLGVSVGGPRGDNGEATGQGFEGWDGVLKGSMRGQHFG